LKIYFSTVNIKVSVQVSVAVAPTALAVDPHQWTPSMGMAKQATGSNFSVAINTTTAVQMLCNRFSRQIPIILIEKMQA